MNFELLESRMRYTVSIQLVRWYKQVLTLSCKLPQLLLYVTKTVCFAQLFKTKLHLIKVIRQKRTINFGNNCTIVSSCNILELFEPNSRSDIFL